jgi:glutamyl-tRNA reductase
MDIFVLGMGHHRAPVEIRERLARPGALDHEYLYKLQTQGVLDEGLLLSTCNRLEIVGVTSGSKEEARDRILSYLEWHADIPRAAMDRLSHFHANDKAVGYLYKVAAGLDSQVLGENQILGQVRDAFKEAMHFRTAGPMVNKLFHKCFQVAKRIRSETGLTQGRVSMASAAVNTALESLRAPDFKDLTALIIGAGEMSSLLASHIAAKNVKKLLILSRSAGRAQTLAHRHGAEVRTMLQLGESLVESDLVFSAAGGGNLVLLKNEILPLLPKRNERPWRIFDLGVPRNVESGVGDLPGVTLKNIDSFTAEVRLSQEARAREAKKAEAIIEDEVLKFREWHSSLAARPTIKDLTERAEETRRAELHRTISKNRFTEKEIESLDAMSKALVRKLLHNPLMFTKSCHRHWRAEFNLGMVRKIFGLD